MKNRITSITMDMGTPVAVGSVSISSDGQIRMHGQDGEPFQHAFATVERFYERPKAPKILSRIPLKKQNPLRIDPNDALHSFDTIFALDTNSREIRGQSVSIAAITLAKWSTRGPHPTICIAPTQAMEFRDVDCHPDLLALKYFIRQIEATSTAEEAGRVAVVIDSHLGNLPKIESREVPILDDYYLPNCVTIVYASDAANDRLPNALIRSSDKAANNLLDQIQARDLYPESPEPFHDHATYFRIWNVRGNG